MNQVFQSHQVKARLLPVNPKTKEQLAILAPSFALVPIKRAKSTRISKVADLLPELRAAVREARRQPVAVRFTDELCSYLEIARDDAQPLALDLHNPKDYNRIVELQPYSALVGRSYTYGVRDEVLSLTDSAQGSVFVAGMQGSGKSTFMSAYLSTMAIATSPERLHIYLVDMKHRSFVPFEGLPHVAAAAYDENSAAQVVQHVYQELVDRKKETRDYRVLLAIDELRELKYADSDLLELLSRIASLGRELGVSLLCATQKPLSSELGPIIKSQFAVRVVGTMEDANASHTVTGRAGLHAHLLAGKGSMLLVATGREATRIQVYNMDPQLVTQLVAAAGRRWSASVKPVKMAIKEESTIAPVALSGRVDRAAGDAQKIAAIFEEYHQGGGSFATGAKSRFTRLIVGDGATYEGGNAARVNKAIQYLLAERRVAQ